MSNAENPSASLPVQDDQAAASAASRPRWGIIAAVLFIFVAIELLILVLVLPGDWDGSITFRFGLVGVLGFWLACGRAPWWLRCILVVVVIPLLTLFDRLDSSGEGALVLGASVLIFAGIAFALRAVISLVSRASNRHHSISIKGIMLAMVGSALVFVFLRAIAGIDGTAMAAVQLTTFVVQIAFLGIAYQLQCVAVWVSGRRFFWWWGGAALSALVIMAVAFTIHQTFVGDGHIREWLEIYGMGSLSIWLAAYPLDTVLRRLGWSLAQPAWYLSESQSWEQKATKTQMSSTDERYPQRESSVETVDFDDMV